MRFVLGFYINDRFALTTIILSQVTMVSLNNSIIHMIKGGPWYKGMGTESPTHIWETTAWGLNLPPIFEKSLKFPPPPVNSKIKYIFLHLPLSPNIFFTWSQTLPPNKFKTLIFLHMKHNHVFLNFHQSNGGSCMHWIKSLSVISTSVDCWYDQFGFNEISVELTKR